MATGDQLSFGPFVLDTIARRLTRDGEEVLLGDRHLDLLCLLTSRPGEVLSKDLLTDTAWRGVAVTTNSLDQAISMLRRTLTLPSGEPCIETRARRGYRFVAKLSPVVRRESDEALDAVMEAHRSWIEGRAALETLDGRAIVRARGAFERVVAQMPHQATAHVGLANACALQFEMTRVDTEPNVAALTKALEHALEARRLDPKYGEAWATLGFVLERVGRRHDALAAARQSIVLEPDNWRHHLRLSAASWGEERVREARRALQRLPGLPMAHWLAASVLVARGLLADAEGELRTALTAAHADTRASSFGCVALHWLLGLLLLARGAREEALEAFGRELALEHSGHLYARECAANTWYAIGATRFAARDHDAAREAFLECLQRVPSHPMARAALCAAPPAASLSPVDAAMALAVKAAASDDRDGCEATAVLLERALAEAPHGNAGWLLPVEPMLAVSVRPAPWLAVHARLRSRAA